MRNLKLSVFSLLCLLNGNPAQAFGNCLDAGYLDHFVAGLPPQPCDDEYYTTITAATGTATLRVIQLSAQGRDPLDPWIPLVRDMAAAVGQATDQIGTGRLPREITILLTPGSEATPSRITHADTTRIPGGECRIVFYKLPEGAAPEEFTFTLAHEIFHCIQYETWLSAARVAEAGWWVEGSAEYFAHLAAPGTGLGQDFVQGFDSASLTRSLTELEYETVVFFAWLGNADPGNVGNFLTRMAPGDQISILQGLIGESDWASFVEAWLDGRLSLPGGTQILPAPYASGSTRFTRSGEITLSVKPYAINRWGAQFAEDMLFDLTHDAATGRLKMKDLIGGEAWTDPPETINTCEGERRTLIYLTTTGSETEATITVDTNEEDRGGTCCLTGKWLPDNAALEGFATFGNNHGGAFLGAAGGSMSCGYGGGGWVLTFNADRTGAITYDGYANTCTSTMGEGQIQVDNVRNGATTFSWRITGDGAAWLEFTGHTMTQSMQVKMGPMVQDLSGTYPGPATEATGMAFTCERDRLTVQGMFDLLVEQAGHDRVVAP
jgi:hypothetical protein